MSNPKGTVTAPAFPPILGDRVIYYSPDPLSKTVTPLAAIVTKVLSDLCVNLCVFGERGEGRSTSTVMYSDDADGYSWSWRPDGAR